MSLRQIFSENVQKTLKEGVYAGGFFGGLVGIHQYLHGASYEGVIRSSFSQFGNTYVSAIVTLTTYRTLKELLGDNTQTKVGASILAGGETMLLAGITHWLAGSEHPWHIILSFGVLTTLAISPYVDKKEQISTLIDKLKERIKKYI